MNKPDILLPGKNMGHLSPVMNQTKFSFTFHILRHVDFYRFCHRSS